MRRGTCTCEAAVITLCLVGGFMEGLLQPLHLLFLPLLIFGVPFFLVCRGLWRKGSR
jgi:hypothetical protein